MLLTVLPKNRTEIFKIVGGCVLLFAAPYSAGTLQDAIVH